MYRSSFPKSGKVIVSTEVMQKLKDFIKIKSSNKTQEEITKENKDRLKILFEENK